MEENQFLRDLYGQLEGDPDKYGEFQENMISNPRFRKDLYDQLQGNPDKFGEFERQFVPEELMPRLDLDLPGLINSPIEPGTASTIDPFNVFDQEERPLTEEELFRQKAGDLLSKGSQTVVGTGEGEGVENIDLRNPELKGVYEKDGSWYAQLTEDYLETSPDLLHSKVSQREKEIYLGPSPEFVSSYNLMPPEERSRRYQEDPNFAEQVWKASAAQMNEELGITTKKEFDAVISDDTSDYYTNRSIFEKVYNKTASKMRDVSTDLEESYPVEFKEIIDLEDSIEEEQVRINTLRRNNELTREDVQYLNNLYEKYEKAIEAPVDEEGTPISQTPLMEERFELMERVDRFSEWYDKTFQQSAQIGIEERASEVAKKVQSELDAKMTGRGYLGRLSRGKLEGFANRFLGNIALAYSQGLISLAYGGDDSKAPQSLIDTRNKGEEYMRIGESAQGTSDVGSSLRQQIQLDDGNIAVIDEGSGQIIAIEKTDGRNAEDSYDPYQFLLVEKEVANKFEKGDYKNDFSWRRFVSESVDVGLDMIPMFVGSAGLTRAMGSIHSAATGGKVMSNVMRASLSRAGSAGSIYSTMVGGHFLGALDQGLTPKEAWSLGTTNAAIEALVAVSIGNVETRLTRRLSFRDRGTLKNALRDIYTGGKVGYKQISSILAEAGNLPRDIVMNVIEENTIIALQAIANAEAGIEGAGITSTDVFNTSAIAASMGAMMSVGAAATTIGRRGLTFRDRLAGNDTFASRIARGVVEADPSLDILIDEIASSNKVEEVKAANIKEGLNRIRDEYNNLPENLSEEDRGTWALNAIKHLDAEVNETNDAVRAENLIEFRNAMDAIVEPKITGEEAIKVQLREAFLESVEIPAEMEGELQSYANMEDGSYIKVNDQWFRYETAEKMYKPVVDEARITELESNEVEATTTEKESFEANKGRVEETEDTSQTETTSTEAAEDISEEGVSAESTPIEEATTPEESWYFDKQGNVVEVRREGDNWVTTQGDVSAQVPTEFAEQAESNVGIGTTPQEITNTLPENVVMDSVNSGPNKGTIAVFNPETNTWHDSDPEGTVGKEITASRKIRRLNEALENKQTPEQTQETVAEEGLETPESAPAEEAQTAEPIPEGDQRKVSVKIAGRDVEYTETEPGVWESPRGKVAPPRILDNINKQLEQTTESPTEAAQAPEATTPTETTPTETTATESTETVSTEPQTTTLNIAGREVTYTREDTPQGRIWKNNKGETLKESNFTKRLDNQFESQTEDTSTPEGSTPDPQAITINYRGKDRTYTREETPDRRIWRNEKGNELKESRLTERLDNEFSKEEQGIIEEGDGILEESTADLGRATETDGDDAQQEAVTDRTESDRPKRAPKKVRGQKTIRGKAYNPAGKGEWVDAETGEAVNKNSHVYEALEGWRDLKKQDRVEEETETKKKEVKSKEEDLNRITTEEKQSSEAPTDALTENMRFSRGEVASKLGVNPESIVPLPVNYTPKSGDVLVDNNTGQVVRLKGVAMGRDWFVDNLTTGNKGETRGSLHLIGEWSIVEGGVPRMSAPTTVRVPYQAKKKARISTVKSILNYFSNALGLSNNIVANASEMSYRLTELGFLSVESAKEFYEGNTGTLPLEKPQFFGNEVHDVVGFYDPLTNQIYLDPNKISPTDTMEEFTHMFQHAVRIASMKGDNNARAILNNAKRVFKSEVDSILKGGKGKLGLKLDSSLYKRLENESESSHRDRILDEVWAKATAPEALRKFREEIQGKKDASSNLKRRIVGLFNKAKNFFLDSLGIDRNKLNSNPTIEQVISQTSDAVLRGDFLSNLSTLQSPTIESSLEMTPLKKGDYNDNGTVKESAVEEINSEKDSLRESEGFMKAPNGKTSNLTEEQWLLTQTQRFKDWFGDSKVLDNNGEPKVLYGRVNTPEGAIMETVFVKSDQNMDSIPSEGISMEDAMVAYDALQNYSEGTHLRFSVEKGRDEVNNLENQRTDFDNLAQNRRIAAREFGRMVRDKTMPEAELQKIYDAATKNRDNIVKVLSNIEGFQGEEGRQAMQDTMNIFDSVAEEWADRMESTPELFYSSVLSNVSFVSEIPLTDGTAMGRVTINNIGQFVIRITNDANVTTPVHELAHIFDYYMTDKEKNDVAKFYFGEGRTWDGETDLREAFANGFLEYIRSMANAPDPSTVPAISKVYDNMKDFFLNLLTDTKLALKEKDQYTNFNGPTRAIYELMSTLSLPLITQQEIKQRRQAEKKLQQEQQSTEYRLQNWWFDRIVSQLKNEYSSQINNVLIDVKQLPQNMDLFYVKVAQHEFVTDPTTAIAFAENMLYQMSQGVEIGEGNNPHPSAVAISALGSATEAMHNVYKVRKAKLEKAYAEEGLENALKRIRKKALSGEPIVTSEAELLTDYNKLLQLVDVVSTLSQASSNLGSTAGFILGMRSHHPEESAIARYQKNTGKKWEKLSLKDKEEFINLERQKAEVRRETEEEMKGTQSAEERARAQREGAFQRLKEIKEVKKTIEKFRKDTPIDEIEAKKREIANRINKHPGLGLFQKKSSDLNKKSEDMEESMSNDLYSAIRQLSAIFLAENSHINSFTELYGNLLQYVPNLSQNQLYSSFVMADPVRQKQASNRARSAQSIIREEIKYFGELINHLESTTEMFNKPGEFVPQEIPEWIAKMKDYMDHIKYLSTLDESTPQQTAILAAKLDNIASIYETLGETVLQKLGFAPSFETGLDIETDSGTRLSPETLAEMTAKDVANVIEEIKALKEDIRERNLENREKKLLDLISKLDKGTYEGDFGYKYFTDYESSVEEALNDPNIMRILKSDPAMRETIENYQNESNLNSLIQALHSTIQRKGKFASFEEVISEVKSILHSEGHAGVNEAFIMKAIFRRVKPRRLIRDASNQIKVIKEQGKQLNNLIKLLEDTYGKYDKSRLAAEKKSKSKEILDEFQRSEDYAKIVELMDKIRKVSTLDDNSNWKNKYEKELETALIQAQSEFRRFLTGGQATINLEKIKKSLRDSRTQSYKDNFDVNKIEELESKVEQMYEKYKNEDSSENLFSVEDDYQALLNLPGFALKYTASETMEQKRRQELAKKKERELFRNRALKILQDRILYEEGKMKDLKKGADPTKGASFWALKYYKEKIEGEKQKQFEDDNLTNLIKENRIIDSKLREKYAEITGSKGWNVARQIANTPRLLTLAADYSFIFYQGAMTIPIITRRAFAGPEGRANAKELVLDLLVKGSLNEFGGRINQWGKYLTRGRKEQIFKVDKDWFERSQANLARRTYYSEGVNAKLQLTDSLNMKIEDRLNLDSFVEKLLNHSDFSFHYLDKIGASGLNRVLSTPIRLLSRGLGGSARAIRVFSERMYVSYMNELRMQLFEQGMEQIDNLGLDRTRRAEAAESWAEHINVLTGTKRKWSSNEGANRTYNDVMKGATVFLTAPRLYTSAFQSTLRTMYDPMVYFSRLLRKDRHITTGKNSNVEAINKQVESESFKKRAAKANMSAEEFMLQEYVRQMSIDHYMTNAIGTAMLWGTLVSLQTLITGLGMAGAGDEKWKDAFWHSTSTIGNPLSIDFMRLNVGGRVITLNPMASYFRTWLGLLPLIAVNTIREKELDEYLGPRNYTNMNVQEIAFDIFKYKVTPLAGPANALMNRDFKGDPVSDSPFTRAAIAAMMFTVPIAGQDVIENIREEGFKDGLKGGLIEGSLDLLGLNNYQLDPYSDSRVRVHVKNENFRARYYIGESYGNKQLANTYEGLMIKNYIRSNLGEQILNSIKDGRPMTKKQMNNAHKRIAIEAFIFYNQPVPSQLRTTDRIRSF